MKKATLFTYITISALATSLVVVSMIWPALYGSFFPFAAHQPQLPIAEAREDGEIYDFEEEKALALQRYPSLSNVEDVREGDWIHIPSINVHVPMVMSPTMNDDDVLSTLDEGAALYPNGVLPGHLGNTFISAHSTGEPWKGAYRFAFLRIGELAEGNVIHLDYKGTRYTYWITGSDIVVPTPEFRVVSGRPVPTMNLMACWPLWTTNQRLLVKAELTNITKLTEKPF